MLHRIKNVWKIREKKDNGSKRRDRKNNLNENSEARLRDDDSVLSKPQHMKEFHNLLRIKSKKTYGKQRCPKTCVVS